MYSFFDEDIYYMGHEKARHVFLIISFDETHGEFFFSFWVPKRSNSPGSQVRSYLRYKRIPHEWLVRNSAERMQEHQKYAKLPLVPTLVTPDGEGLQDSTPIMEEMEKRFPERSIHPPGAVSKFISELLEEFGDEWGSWVWIVGYAEIFSVV